MDPDRSQAGDGRVNRIRLHDFPRFLLDQVHAAPGLLDRLLTATNSADATTSRTCSYNSAGSIATNSAIGSYRYPAQGVSAVRPHTPT